MEGTKMLETLGISLLIIAVVFGLVYISSAKLKEITCENIDGGLYTGGDCKVSATNSTANESKAFLSIETVESAIDVALGFIALVVLIAIVVVIIKMVRGALKG